MGVKNFFYSGLNRIKETTVAGVSNGFVYGGCLGALVARNYIKQNEENNWKNVSAFIALCIAVEIVTVPLIYIKPVLGVAGAMSGIISGLEGEYSGSTCNEIIKDTIFSI